MAKQYVKDVSRLEDLYQSQDKHFYDMTDAIAPSNGTSSIPECELLKQGMMEQERIEHNYVAYQIAQALEQKLK